MAEKFSESKFYKDRVKNRRSATKAVAYIERGKWAGIPNKHLRVRQEEFRSILYDNFYGGAKGAKEVVEKVYTNPKTVSKIPFITIDGGDVVSRKRAGYTALFRQILCDKWGYHCQCSHLLSLFQAGFSKDKECAEMIKELQRYDVLFISEVNESIVDARVITGPYFDEVLDSRADNNKLTIISFANPISKTSRLGETCGDYMGRLSSQVDNGSDVLRIKVEKMKNA
jgi:hypothetical protein